MGAFSSLRMAMASALAAEEPGSAMAERLEILALALAANLPLEMVRRVMAVIGAVAVAAADRSPMELAPRRAGTAITVLSFSRTRCEVKGAF